MSPPLKPGAGNKKARHKGGHKAPFLSKIALKNATTFKGFESASRVPSQKRAALRLI
jgi:hypothetical protein